MAESKGFFRRTPVRLRVTSLLDHVGKNSPPDCFLSADCVCSLLVRIPLFVLPKQKAGLATCFSFWRRARDFFGALPCTFASLRSLTTSAKTVHRTVFFPQTASAPSLFESLYLFLPMQKAGLATCFSFWRRARDSNPRTGFDLLHDFQSCSFGQLGQLSKFIFTI